MTSHPFLHGTSNRHNNRIPSPRCLPVTVVIIVLRGSNAAIEMESDCKMKCTKETECRSLANQRRERKETLYFAVAGVAVVRSPLAFYPPPLTQYMKCSSKRTQKSRRAWLERRVIQITGR